MKKLKTWHTMVLVSLSLLLAAFAIDKAQDTPARSIERMDPRLDKLIPKDAKIEELAGGFIWSEGPVWLPSEKCLVFSDIPNNVVNKWKQGQGLSQYLRPSGYTGNKPRSGEMGSNALLLDPQGRLVLCQHGDRRVARKVDIHGNLFATGPGGLHIFAPDGTHLGAIKTGVATANCAWGDDGSVLYITAHMNLIRLKTTTKGKGF